MGDHEHELEVFLSDLRVVLGDHEGDLRDVLSDLAVVLGDREVEVVQPWGGDPH